MTVFLFLLSFISAFICFLAASAFVLYKAGKESRQAYLNLRLSNQIFVNRNRERIKEYEFKIKQLEVEQEKLRWQQKCWEPLIPG